MASATLSKDEILEAIGNMSVFELAELIEAFKTKFNVTIAAAPAGGAAAGGGAGAPPPVVEEQTEFTVTLKAGKIAYKCTVPGHAANGMKGKLTVT